jgi:hypothetical protein
VSGGRDEQADAPTSGWVRGKPIDRKTDAENHAIEWSFTAGDKGKIRLINEVEGSDHPMHHPFLSMERAVS